MNFFIILRKPMKILFLSMRWRTMQVKKTTWTPPFIIHISICMCVLSNKCFWRI